jgi:Response regulator receiver domain
VSTSRLGLTIRLAVACGLIASATAIHRLIGLTNTTTVALSYLLIVLAVATGWGLARPDGVHFYPARGGRQTSMNQAKILVVDDEPQIRRTLRAALAPWGYAVADASSGEAALEKLRDGDPDLVWLDLNMPGMGASPPAGASGTAVMLPSSS